MKLSLRHIAALAATLSVCATAHAQIVPSTGVRAGTQSAAPFAAGQSGIWFKVSDGLPYFRKTDGVTDLPMTGGGGGGSVIGIKGAYQAGTTAADNRVPVTSTLGPVEIDDNATPQTIFIIRDAAQVNTYFKVSATVISIPGGVVDATDGTASSGTCAVGHGLQRYNSSAAAWQQCVEGGGWTNIGAVQSVTGTAPVVASPTTGAVVVSLNLGASLTTSSGNLVIAAPVSIANGGTNSTTALSGSSIIVSNGTAIVQGPAGTTTTVLHGNASGTPTYGAVVLTTDVSGTLGFGNGGTGQSSNWNQGGIIYAVSTTVLASNTAGTAGQITLSGGTGAPTFDANLDDGATTSGVLTGKHPFALLPNASTGTPANGFAYTAPAHTALTAEHNSWLFTSATQQFTAASAPATQRQIVINANTYTATASATTTTAATVAINAAPTCNSNLTCTNTYALWVQAGKTELDGSFTMSTGAFNATANAASQLTTSSGALTITSAAGATWSTTAGTLVLSAGGVGGTAIQQVVQTTGSPSTFTVTAPAHTTLTIAEQNDVNINLARTVNFASGGGTVTTQRAMLVQAPTYTATTNAVTLTSAATLAISGAPVASTNIAITNAYALWVQGGNVLIAGRMALNGGAVDTTIGLISNGGLRVDSGSIVGLRTGNNDDCFLYTNSQVTGRWSSGLNLEFWDGGSTHRTAFFAQNGNIVSVGDGGFGSTTTDPLIMLDGTTFVGEYPAQGSFPTTSGATGTVSGLNSSITLSATTGMNQRGVVYIENEVLSYSGASAGTIGGTSNNINRGIWGTTNVSHATGLPVIGYQLYSSSNSGQPATAPYFAFTAAGTFGMGVAIPGATIDIVGSTFTSSNTWVKPTALRVAPPAHTSLTASTEVNDVYFHLARTAQFATGAITTQRAFYIEAPTYGFVGASTITTAATVDIAGAPAQGTNATITNSYALRIEAGAINMGGTTFASLGTPQNGTFIYCSDCTIANPCAGSGTGALAKRLNGAWVCN